MVCLENTVKTAVDICFSETTKCYFKNAFLKILSLRCSKHDCDDLPLPGAGPPYVQSAGYILPSHLPRARVRRYGTELGDVGHRWSQALEDFSVAATSRKGVSI